MRAARRTASCLSGAAANRRSNKRLRAACISLRHTSRQGSRVICKEAVAMASRFLGPLAIVSFAAASLANLSATNAQSFGVELNNTLMPASGGMAGVSIAQPQDLTSAINGNPATLTQFRGTQFLFGGAWSEPTFNLTQTSNIPIVGPPPHQPFSAKSTAAGVPGGSCG